MSAGIQKNPDEDHLRLLAIFHYVLAGMNFFAGCFPIFHVSLGIAMLAGAFDGGRNPPPPGLGALFTCIGGGIMLFFWTLAALKVMAGRCLTRHSGYGFCYAVACIECLQMPMGTTLGVFTIVVLSRDSVKALFAGIEYRDPRMDALDDFDDDLEQEPGAPSKHGSQDEAIREKPSP